MTVRMAEALAAKSLHDWMRVRGWVVTMPEAEALAAAMKPRVEEALAQARAEGAQEAFALPEFAAFVEAATALRECAGNMFGTYQPGDYEALDGACDAFDAALAALTDRLKEVGK